MDWINQGEDGDKWMSLMNAVMILPVPLSTGNVLMSLGTVRSLGGNLLLGSN